MSLLRDIQDAAIDSDIELSTLLRKCKVLSSRLGSVTFKQWIDNELNGYQDVADLPSYRILKVHSKGYFSGPFQSGMNNADIPLSCIDKRFHKNLKYSYFIQPIASIEALVQNDETGYSQEPWNPDLVAHVGGRIYQGMNCIQAWKVIPTPAIIALVDTVRTRILNFVLEIEAEAPDAGEAPANSTPVPQEKVTQIFNTYISGQVQNVATGGSNFRQEASSTGVNESLFSDLLNALSSSNADAAIVKELSEIVEEMKSVQGTSSFKLHYQKFMSLVSDHMQVFGPIVAPFIPTLTGLIP